MDRKTAILAAIGLPLGLMAAVFHVWTATCGWSFPLFLLCVAYLLYVPGRFLVDLTRLEIGTLDHLSLSLVLGMLSSSLAFWLAVAAGRPWLVHAWPLAAIAGLAAFRFLRSNRSASRLGKPRGEHAAIGALVLAAWALLAFHPLYFRNLTVAPDSGIAALPASSPCGQPDALLHLSITNELTHTVPPQVPFVAGKPLSYHYGMDVLAAMFVRTAGLDPFDVTVRFLPALLLGMAILSIFVFSRLWLGSPWGAVLTATLVIFGEDFSFVPGLCLRSGLCWSAQYFSAPTTFSLYYLNPMLPALVVLFSAFYSLTCFLGRGGRPALLAAACQAALLLEYKVFSAVQLLGAALLTAFVWLVRFRDGRMAKAAAMMAMLAFPLLAAIALTNHSAARQALLWRPGQFIHAMLAQWRLADKFGEAAGGWFMPFLLVIGYAMATVVYLVGCLGLRIVGVPRMARELAAPRPDAPMRFLLSAFVATGIAASLLFAVVFSDKAQNGQYDNIVWFLVQSKYVAWLFAVEAILPLLRTAIPWKRTLALTAIFGLSVPSTIQFFHHMASDAPRAGSVEERNLFRFFQTQAVPGSVVLCRSELAIPLTAATPCRTPIDRLYTSSFVASAELDRRCADIDDFWRAWDQGIVNREILDRYQIAYAVCERRFPEPSPLRREYSDSRFVVYRFGIDSTRRAP